MDGQIIFIFGGTGSLGYELNTRYKERNIIYNFSRDENKHWQMRIYFQDHKNIHFIIGNVVDIECIQRSILRVQPTIIIIASAMKHIDQCEKNAEESMKTNVIGVQNILNVIEKNKTILSALECVIFVSSDKACSPINNYGLCKALSENLVIEKSLYVPSFRFVNVRYGNVLNSNGSIIPLLHKIGQNDNYTHFQLTSDKMTRFVMTLEQSVNLIEHAILNGTTGDTIIPELISMKLVDLFTLFSMKYNKPIRITGLRPGEKIVESLINETQSGRIIKQNNYIHIQSVFKKDCIYDETHIPQDYNSKLNTLSIDELREYLQGCNLL